MPKPRYKKHTKRKPVPEPDPTPTPQELVDEAEEALADIVNKLYTVARKVSMLRDKLTMGTTRIGSGDDLPF